jgi:CRISPR-associated protein Cmr1
MNALTATYRVVTPMFLGAADPLREAELRTPSFKGALRFWWRALMWERIRKMNLDAAAATNALRDTEDRLFGSTRTGQSSVLLSIEWMDAQPGQTADWPPNQPSVGSTYLGFGITENRRGNITIPHRQGFQERQAAFRVLVRLRRTMDDEEQHGIKAAFRALGLFGGLGNRSRRAFGSIAIETLDGVDLRCSDLAAYEAAIQQLLANVIGRETLLPPYTAFSQLSALAVSSNTASTAREAHNTLGEAYRRHRGQPSSLRGRHKIPFGLPLQKVDETRRRGSPLIFHVHPIGDRFAAAVLFLPARFHPELPDGDRHEFYTNVKSFLNISDLRLIIP